MRSKQLAEAVAQSGLFGIKTKSQALVLMSISQAEGRHPALAARDYNIIQNRVAKTAEAMQRDFMSAGGRIEWHDLSDDVADATFSHPQGGKVRIAWDQARVQTSRPRRARRTPEIPPRHAPQPVRVGRRAHGVPGGNGWYARP